MDSLELGEYLQAGGSPDDVDRDIDCCDEDSEADPQMNATSTVGEANSDAVRDILAEELNL